jgi:hypothetical protein
MEPSADGEEMILGSSQAYIYRCPRICIYRFPRIRIQVPANTYTRCQRIRAAHRAPFAHDPGVEPGLHVQVPANIEYGFQEAVEISAVLLCFKI